MTYRLMILVLSLICGLGVVLETVESFGMGINGDRLVLVVVTSLIGSLVVFASRYVMVSDVGHKFNGEVSTLLIRFQWTVVVVVALTVLLAYLRSGQSPVSGFVDVNMFRSRGEDNSKWLAVASQISSDQSVSIGSVGGVLAVIIALSVAIYRLLSYFFSWSTDSVHSVTGSVMLSYLAPMVLAPLALTGWCRRRRTVDRSMFVLGASISCLVMLAMFSRAFGIGHLSLVWAIFILSFGLIGLMAVDSSENHWSIHLFLFGAGSTTWLGFRPLSAVVILIGLVVPFTRAGGIVSKVSWCIPFAPIGVVLWETLQYVNHRSGYLSSLFAAGGATLEVSSTFSLLTLVVVYAAVRALVDSGSRRLNHAAPTFLLAFGLLLVTYSLLSTGAVNYGAIKGTVLIYTVLLISCLPIALDKLAGRIERRHRMIPLLILLLSAAQVDGLLVSSLQFSQSRTWIENVNAEDRTWRHQTLEPDGSPKKTDEIPISCVLLGENREVVVSDATYMCTRTMIALSGRESLAGPIIEWQLRRDWFASIDYLREMEDSILNRYALIIDSAENVMGKVVLRNIVWRSDGLIPEEIVAQVS